MSTFVLKLTPDDVIQLLRAEIDAARGAPELAIAARKEFIIEEEFDAAAHNLSDATDYDLVTSTAILTVEPRVEGGYWVLETAVERKLGPVRRADEIGMTPSALSLDEFETEVNGAGPAQIDVRLVTESAEGKQDFDAWLAALQARHAGKRVKRGEAARSADRSLILTVSAIWSVGAMIYFGAGNSLSPTAPSTLETGSAENHVKTVAATETTSAAPAEAAAPAAPSAPAATAPAAAPVAAASNDELLTLSKDPKQWVSPTGDYYN
ncbi:MAG: hypothetical protein ACR652_14615, partial [Methylocystis sp.]|uniref:hypothetical protein n=1 Tax=Methylocystis sp. TaxID=1911079 RepID=UPI003DA60A75